MQRRSDDMCSSKQDIFLTRYILIDSKVITGCRGRVLAGELVGVTRDLQMEGIRVHVASCNAVVVLETDIGA
jgi:hypothetical protein